MKLIYDIRPLSIDYQIYPKTTILDLKNGSIANKPLKAQRIIDLRDKKIIKLSKDEFMAFKSGSLVEITENHCINH